MNVEIYSPEFNGFYSKIRGEMAGPASCPSSLFTAQKTSYESCTKVTVM
jgi:hypothetical protein